MKRVASSQFPVTSLEDRSPQLPVPGRRSPNADNWQLVTGHWELDWSGL